MRDSLAKGVAAIGVAALLLLPVGASLVVVLAVGALVPGGLSYQSIWGLVAAVILQWPLGWFAVLVLRTVLTQLGLPARKNDVVRVSTEILGESAGFLAAFSLVPGIALSHPVLTLLFGCASAFLTELVETLTRKRSDRGQPPTASAPLD